MTTVAQISAHNIEVLTFLKDSRNEVHQIGIEKKFPFETLFSILFGNPSFDLSKSKFVLLKRDCTRLEKWVFAFKVLVGKIDLVAKEILFAIQEENETAVKELPNLKTELEHVRLANGLLIKEKAELKKENDSLYQSLLKIKSSPKSPTNEEYDQVMAERSTKREERKASMEALAAKLEQSLCKDKHPG